VVNALKMAVWRRDHDGHKVQKGLIHHSDYAEVCVKPRNCGMACAGRVALFGSSA
jgi:hypothetical protein